MLKKLLLMANQEVFDYTSDVLNMEVYDGFSVLFTKSPIVLQAHVDTVCKVAPTQVAGDKILSTNGILGADDRAGVYAALAIAQFCKKRNFVIPNIVFTDYEESGAIGMQNLTEIVRKADVKHMRLMLSLDRQGVGEYVTYNKLPEQVHKYVESFGFHHDFGSFSDCKLFTEKYLIPSVNVSVGYHNQHTEREFLCVDELNLTINRVIDMIRNPIDKLYKCEKQPVAPKIYDYRYYKNNDYWRNDMEYCDYCGSAATKLHDIYEYGIAVCDKCYEYFNENGGEYETNALYRI